jgi:hypothetical protein
VPWSLGCGLVALAALEIRGVGQAGNPEIPTMQAWAGVCRSSPSSITARLGVRALRCKSHAAGRITSTLNCDEVGKLNGQPNS